MELHDIEVSNILVMAHEETSRVTEEQKITEDVFPGSPVVKSSKRKGTLRHGRRRRAINDVKEEEGGSNGSCSSTSPCGDHSETVGEMEEKVFEKSAIEGEKADDIAEKVQSTCEDSEDWEGSLGSLQWSQLEGEEVMEEVMEEVVVKEEDQAPLMSSSPSTPHSRLEVTQHKNITRKVLFGSLSANVEQELSVEDRVVGRKRQSVKSHVREAEHLEHKQEGEQDSLTGLAGFSQVGHRSQCCHPPLLQVPLLQLSDLQNAESDEEQEGLQPPIGNAKGRRSFVLPRPTTLPSTVSRQAPRTAKTQLAKLPSQPSTLSSLGNSVETTQLASPAGFSTAGGRRVQVSEEAMAQARQVLGSNPSDPPSRETLRNQQQIRPETYKTPSVERPSCGEGFTTGRGQPVRVSAEALAKAKSVLGSGKSSWDGAVAEDKQIPWVAGRGNPKPVGGFTTARGKPVQISEEALAKAKSVLGTKMPEELKPPACVGFSTGRGKPVTVSEEALAKARNVLRDETSNSEQYKAPGLGGFSTGRGKPVMVSEEALHGARSVLGDEAKKSNVSDLGGFSTGGGKPVTVSEKALARARTVLEGDKSISRIATSVTLGTPATSKLGNPVVTREALSGNQGGTARAGFSTARGQKVEVSEDALAQARGLLADTGNGRGQSDSVEEEFATEWDEEEMAPMITTKTSEAIEAFTPYICHPDDLVLPSSPYRGGPELLHEVALQSGASSFATPFTGGVKRRGEEVDFGAVLGKQRRGEGELEEEEEDGSVEDKRRRASEKQERIIASKKTRSMTPTPGRLLTKRSLLPRLPPPDLLPSPPDHCPAPLMALTSTTSHSWRFPGTDFFSRELVEGGGSIALGDGLTLVLGEDGAAGREEVGRALLACPGVAPSLVPEGWLENHWRWVVWSLACLERRTGLRTLSPAAAVDRLRLRYHREVVGGERSVLRRLLEREEGPGVPMVLCVAEVGQHSLLLTDGWYSLPCPLSPGSPLLRLVQQARVQEGTKLLTQGAELQGPEQGCHPLQAEGKYSLRLQVNSTRRVRWHQRLGRSAPLTVGLAGLLEGGGGAPLLRCRVARLYPLLYWVKEQGGGSSYLTERQWEERQGREGEGGLHALVAEVERGVAREEQQGRSRSKRLRERELEGVTCGEELYDLVTASGDPHLAACLTSEQRQAMEAAAGERSEAMRRKVEEEVRRRLKERGGRGQATPLLRARLVDAKPGEGEERSGLLTVWRPGSGVLEELREGRVLGITGCGVTRVEGRVVHLTSSRSSQYLQLEGEAPQEERVARRLTDLASLAARGFAPLFNEVDTVAVVARVEPALVRGFHTVVLTDQTCRVARLLLWAGRQGGPAFRGLLEGRVLYLRDLEWRPQHSPGPLPALYLRETSSLSSCPREEGPGLALSSLQAVLASPESGLLVRARENLLLQQRGVWCSTGPSPTPPPSTTAWGARALTTEARLAALDSYSQAMARRAGGPVPFPSSQPPLPMSPQVQSPYRPPARN